MQDQLDSSNEANKEVKPEVEQPKMGIDHPDFLKPYRLETENFYQYRVRRKMGQMYVKHKAMGQFMWISKDARQPVFAEDDKEMKGKPIGYQVSRGFTYNKAQVAAAYAKYIREQAAKKIETETNKTQE